MRLWSRPFSASFGAGLCRRLLWACVLGFLLAPAGHAFAQSLILSQAADGAARESLITVPDSEDSPWLFQWFVDGRALTADPIPHAGQLVVYWDKASPGSEYEVVVYKDGAALASQALSLNPAPSNGTNDPGNGTPNTPGGPGGGGGGDGGASNPAPLSPASLTPPAGMSVLINLSTRGQVKPDTPLIAGLIVSGSMPKPILIRAVGPTLASFGVSDALKNPTLTLYHDGQVIQTNDDWDSSAAAGLSAVMQAVGAFPLNPGSRDAVLWVNLAPGAYTAHVNSADSTPGTALVEFYDTSAATAAQARLGNLSSRGFSASGNNVMIVGIIIGGDRPKTVLVRALGPMLQQYGVNDAMPDPKLELRQGDNLLGVNDDWETTADKSRVVSVTQATGAPALPSNSRDAALVLTLNPGAYTAIVTTGASSGEAGEVLVEAYETPGG